jgi:hypothetical protein
LAAAARPAAAGGDVDAGAGAGATSRLVLRGGGIAVEQFAAAGTAAVVSSTRTVEALAIGEEARLHAADSRIGEVIR